MVFRRDHHRLWFLGRRATIAATMCLRQLVACTDEIAITLRSKMKRLGHPLCFSRYFADYIFIECLLRKLKDCFGLSIALVVCLYCYPVGQCCNSHSDCFFNVTFYLVS